ncbi:hypothetical protein P148_SR1C00001G0747 [candidate division SR1 bacterium RAAC1_SR1_1]|nr:hypothetical protein P148_SR1C00001G0747 [candidate division SR1 bacterium RAAC1_SR1_1]
MKKTSFGILLLALFSLIGSTTFASDCKQVEFENGDGRVCVNIEKDDDETFQLETDIEKGNGALRCGILLSNNTYKEIAGCNNEFFVSNSKEQLIKLYIKLGSEYPTDWDGKPNNKTERLFPQWMYDFEEGEWTDGISNNDDDDDDNDAGDVDNFYVTTDDTTPSINQRVDLKIKARDSDNGTVTDYTNAVEFVVYYKTSSSSSWRETTSSTYFELDDDYEDGYDFSSSDDGYVTLTDAIRFKKDYEYKVEVVDEDDEDILGYKTFDIGGTSNDDDNDAGDVDNFYVTTDDTTPSINQRVDLKIKARDNGNNTVTDYTNAVDFVVYYKTSSSSSWRETTSSTYFELKSTYNNGYDFSSSDDGYVTLTDAIRFKKDYEYKVEIVDEDDEDILGYETFDIGGTSNDDDNDAGDVDNFYVTTDDTTPSINQRVDLKIKARDNGNNTVTDYTNAVDFVVYYKTSSSSSWIETTSSTYFELDDDYEDGYDFSSSDDGYVTLTDAIRFKKDYEYKVEIVDEDDEDILGYKIFDVGGNDTISDEDLDNFYVTTYDTYPDINERVNLFIKARDNDNNTVTDYRGTVKFDVYYKKTSSSSWTKTTSSTYFELDDQYEDGYTFKSSDDGYATLYYVIKFKKDYDFKVKIVDDNNDDIYGEKIFYIGGDSSETDGYTAAEIENIEKVYNLRDKLIQSLKSSSSKLRYNQTRITMSNDLKEEMRKIINDEDDKEYDDYEEFGKAFNERYSYTLRNK